MADFKFFAPGRADTAGIIAGAQGILAGGQAQGAGLAAAGQAMGQAFANVGSSIAGGIQQKKFDDKQEALLKEASTFAESVAAGDLYETHSYTLEDENTTPALQSIKRQAELRISDGMDAIQSNTIKLDQYMEYFQKQFDLEPEAAARRVDELTAVKEERVMTPEGRSKMVRGAMALTRAGFDPNLLRTMIDAGGTKGYARTQDMEAAKQDRIQALFTLTPAQERQQAVKLDAAKAEAEALREQRKRAQTEVDIQRITTKPFVVPTGTGEALPTGARTTQRATTSPGKVTGATKTLVERARGVGLPTQPIEDEMREPIEYTPITPQQANEIREALIRGGMSPNLLDDEMKRRKLFTGEDDPLLAEVAQARVDDIMRNLNQDAPRFAGGVETQGEQTLIERLGGTAARNMEQGNLAPWVQVGSLTTLDPDAINAALDVPGTSAGKVDVERLKLRIGSDGAIEVFPGSLGSPQKEREVNGVLKRGVFASTAVRDEIALRQSTEGVAITKSETLKFWEAIRSRDPRLAADIIAYAGGFLDDAHKPVNEPQPSPDDPNPSPGGGGLTDVQRSLLNSLTDVGVTRTPGRVPSAEDNTADSRRRAQLPPAEDPIRKQRRESAEEVKPQATELADALKKQAVKAINSGDNGKGQRLLQIVALIRKAVTLNDRGALDSLIAEYSKLVKD